MQLYNSLTRKKELFIPLKDKEVLMYVCGITPYDTTHLGHAFTYTFFDVLYRYLIHLGYKVTYTQNVTDINDRDKDILKKAHQQHTSWNKLADFWTKKFLEDMKNLNWVMPTNYLKASKQITSMIRIIEALLKNGYAYERESNVFLDIKKVKDFGKLSKLTKEYMLIRAKEFEEDIDNPLKKNKLDITLWRAATPDQPAHIPSFKSPFGKGRPASRRGSPGGRPGWHIECSAMAISSLDEQIDIHGGGIDLIYPHHESEIAQSESATGKTPFAKYWIHTGTVLYKGKKMSKSLGNLVMVSDLLKKFSSDTIRFVLLSHNYSEPWEFREKELTTAQESLNIIKSALKIKSKKNLPLSSENSFKRINESLENNMNTPQALLKIISLANIILKENSFKNVARDQNNLRECLKILGFTI